MDIRRRVNTLILAATNYGRSNSISEIEQVRKVESVKKKYSTLNPYLQLAYVYEYTKQDGEKQEFTTSFNYEDFTIADLNKAKKEKYKLKDLTFKKLKFTLKLNGNDKFHRYDINT